MTETQQDPTGLADRMTDERLAEIEARQERAVNELDRLTSSVGGPGNSWRWSIPAKPDRDSDLILGAAVGDATELLAEVRMLRRVAVTLGRIVDRQAVDICRIAGVHMPASGDADFELAWSEAFAMSDRLAGSAGLVDRWTTKRDELLNAGSTDPLAVRIAVAVIETCAAELETALSGDEVAW